MISSHDVPRTVFRSCFVIGAVGIMSTCVILVAMQGAADDFEDSSAPQRQHPPHGTHFWFEVVESFNAKYEGDTPGHVGRGGGLTLHPHVALGDAVHHRIGADDKAVGIITGVTWDRLKGSLTVEFRPQEEHRIAVGDEVWVDLNPVSGGNHRAQGPGGGGAAGTDPKPEARAITPR